MAQMKELDLDYGRDISFLANTWVASFCEWLMYHFFILLASNSWRLFTKCVAVRKKPIIATIDHTWLNVEFVAWAILSPCINVPITAKDRAVFRTAFLRFTSLFII